MVKKISGGGRPIEPLGSKPIDSTKSVESTKVAQVDGVRSAAQAGSSAGVSSNARRITPEHQEKLYQLIDEEAEKLFNGEKIPRARKETIKGALRMVIDAATIREEDEGS